MHSIENSVIPQINNYQLCSPLGVGGFGVVYEGIDKRTQDIVAIKIGKRKTSKSKLLEKKLTSLFRWEAYVCSLLDHKNIVKIIDSGFYGNDEFYVVYEYIYGVNLKEYICQHRKLSIQETIKIMSQILEGLFVTHNHGIIHRDLKPQNIMISKKSNAIKATIIDFGISTHSDHTLHDRSQSIQNRYLGTPTYSAPEQLYKTSLSKQSDIYSWGIVFVECLLGHPPFHVHTNPQYSMHDIIDKKFSCNKSLKNLLKRVTHIETNKRIINIEEIIDELYAISLNLPNDSIYLSDYNGTVLDAYDVTI